MYTTGLIIRRIIIMATLSVSAAGFAGDVAVVALNEPEFRDKVFACWLGKNIGGTLGMPFEGKTQPQDVTFYTNIKKGEPEANDDLDLQILWLKAMQEHDAQVDARILGEYWLKYVPVDWNEYGVGKKNMRRGILPPLAARALQPALRQDAGDELQFAHHAHRPEKEEHQHQSVPQQHQDDR